ncbi:PLP-dependent transferase [Violaceomyces palustris]|uniref:PLP-dependent transferase n=1 Tax=Violaceomyces palustris TaxID=1673888 RepID=A0ACD0NRS6_9BASI|nr:PLP-dependent transferase [Violaceomyces palustris]
MPSAIRSLFPAEQIPGMVSLLSGKPNSETFPLSKIHLELKPSPVNPEGEDGRPVTVTIEGDDLESALQYGPTSGLTKLVDWMEEFQSKVHARPRTSVKDTKDASDRWRVSFGNGSQDLLTKAFEALVDRGDSVVLESPAYSGILPSLKNLGARIFEAETDHEGVNPVKLDKLLTEWKSSPKTSSSPFPKFLYTTPTGANPSGTTASDERKRQVLEVVRKHNILLLEDDPYYFLSFQGLGQDPLTRKRGKSYFSLEVEEENQIWGVGRVLRFDSTSKILSAGLRLGFATGPTPLLDAIDLDTSSRNLQPSGTSQALAYALFRHWGISNFLAHADLVAKFYLERLEFFEARAKENLSGLAEWVKPTAGMFLWIKLKLPPVEGEEDGDSFKLISEKAKEALVLALPGVAFVPGDGGEPGGRKKRSAYVRTSFSVVPLDQVDLGFKRLRGVILKAWEDSGKHLEV